MKPLEQVLTNINECIERYDQCKLGLVGEQTEIARKLSSWLYFLTEHRVTYHEKWMNAYFEHKGSNASRERYADGQVPELYKIRHIHTSGHKVLDTLRTTISANK